MKTARIEESNSESQARAQIESIIEMVENLRAANNDAEDDQAQDEARQTIQDDALDVQVRSDWYTPGTIDVKPSQFMILLCTGGPAVRIVGDLDEYGQPETAHLEHQDWGTPWTVYEYSTAGDQNAALLEYCQQFYFGE